MAEVTTVQDADSDDETFTVALGSLPSSVTAGAANSVAVTITDAAPAAPSTREPLTLSANRTPAEGRGPVTLTVTLNRPAPAGGLTVEVIARGTATSAIDFTLPSPIRYSSNSGRITIAEGETSGTGALTVVNDNYYEGDETIILFAYSPELQWTSEDIEITLKDNDPKPTGLTLSVDRAPAEGGEVVTVTARVDRRVAYTEVFLTVSGTAVAGSDYTLAYPMRTVTAEGCRHAVTEFLLGHCMSIGPGETVSTPAVFTIIDDEEDDDGETIILNATAKLLEYLYKDVLLTLDAPERALTIADND